MTKAINLLPVIPMRKEPAHRSEMVSQLLFGEFVEMLAEENGFLNVKCIYDSYEGWVQANQLTSCNSVADTSLYTKNWMQVVEVNKSPVHIPMCSPVYRSPETVAPAGFTISYGNSIMQLYNTDEMAFTESNLVSVASNFLNTPYLWGGKSVFGIDCSGFVQQVFKLLNRRLLRDAYLQVTQGVAVNSLEEAQAGDLAFFHNDAGKITHVGIILSENKIIHASGKVRIDLISKEGITNDLGILTHNLNSIRTYF
ncbi:MAG: NlpC/P60 family protein [Candidatus Dadabacteria bacterium]